MVAYCYAIDNRDWDALDDVFTPEAIIDYTEMVGIKGNLKEIKAFLAESMKQISNSQHIISTTQLPVEGDRAQGRTICKPDGNRLQWTDRKSTRLNSSPSCESRMPSPA